MKKFLEGMKDYFSVDALFVVKSIIIPVIRVE